MGKNFFSGTRTRTYLKTASGCKRPRIAAYGVIKGKPSSMQRCCTCARFSLSFLSATISSLFRFKINFEIGSSVLSLTLLYIWLGNFLPVIPATPGILPRLLRQGRFRPFLFLFANRINPAGMTTQMNAALRFFQSHLKLLCKGICETLAACRAAHGKANKTGSNFAGSVFLDWKDAARLKFL